MEGRVMEVREVHLTNAPSILVTPSGMFMEVREEQSEKQRCPMEVRVEGRVTEVSLEQ